MSEEELEKKQIEFKDIKEKIQIALNERIDISNFPGETQGLTLIDGFFMQSIQNAVSGNIVIGGPTVPIVAIVGNKSGRIYYFALKALLPTLEI